MVASNDVLQSVLKNIMNQDNHNKEEIRLATENAVLKETNEFLSEQINEMSQQIKILKTRPNANKKLLSYAESIEDLQNQKHNLKIDIKDLEKQVENYQETIRNLEIKLKNKEDEISTYKETIDRQRQDLDEFRNQPIKEKKKIFNIF